MTTETTTERAERAAIAHYVNLARTSIGNDFLSPMELRIGEIYRHYPPILLARKKSVLPLSTLYAHVVGLWDHSLAEIAAELIRWLDRGASLNGDRADIGENTAIRIGKRAHANLARAETPETPARERLAAHIGPGSYRGVPAESRGRMILTPVTGRPGVPAPGDPRAARYLRELALAEKRAQRAAIGGAESARRDDIARAKRASRHVAIRVSASGTAIAGFARDRKRRKRKRRKRRT